MTGVGSWGKADARMPLAALLALGLGIGCTADGQARRDAQREIRNSPAHLEGLRLVEGVDRGRLYVRPDHHVGSYDGFVLDPIRISYKRGQQQLPLETATQLAQKLRDQLSTSILAGGLEVGKEPHECLLTLRIEILDLELLDVNAAGNTATRFLDWSGGAVLIFEFRDSMSDQTLTRYGQRRRLPGGRVSTSGALSSSGLLQRLGEGLNDMGTAIRYIIPTTVAFREGTSCIGKIGRQSGYDASGQRSPNAPPLGRPNKKQ